MLEALKSLISSGHFHHATYRLDFARGLHIYRHEDNGFNGFTHAMYFPERDENCDAAYNLVRSSGVYEGSRR